ncbi:MAG: DUF962 domain-containing protein [Deltaproteobacteria bacterium HGW-Deltaproteobacteria-14]|jgi:hypothetical protein|nr:MAG: DUF962 domain-containing protein [Deltaproteobacteria bacterium HGW-Deltaproteobacteria-14]
MAKRFESYEEFWPYYVSEHQDRTCRRLHFIGTSLVMAMAPNPLLWPALPVAGYGFAWAGHYVFEKNRPATFTYPLWSLRADFRMWRKIVTGEMPEELERAAVMFPKQPVANATDDAAEAAA